MFKNRHVVIAMLVAPMLSIMAWYAVDHFLAEKPHEAKPGAAYLLIAQSNCRYDSGQCDLENGDFQLTLRPGEISEASAAIELDARFSLQSATIALVENEQESPPVKMAAKDAIATRWTGILARPADAEATVRVAVTADESTYYAEVPVIFMRAKF